MNAPGADAASRLERRRLVKICGLREPAHAAAAAAAGADLIGFIFAPARRQVAPATARACIAAARAQNPARNVIAVGVFVDAAPNDINCVVDECGLDLVQLHGSEAPESLDAVRVPAIKALRPAPGALMASVQSDMDRYSRASRPPWGFLIDGYAASVAGGSGARADWDLAAAIGADRPILLGGGLHPGNVEQAIQQVQPIGVDVSSGVEVDGVKNVARIEAFIQAARAAFPNPRERYG